MMSEKTILSGLDEIYRTFSKILEPDAAIVLEAAKAEVRSTKHKYLEYKRRTDDSALIAEPWGYTIGFDRPLRFQEVDCKGLDARVDVCCAMQWEDSETPCRQDLQLRVWNWSSAFREEWDHPRFGDILTDPTRRENGRVIFRCHFDLANPGQEGPEYHVQFGGNARDDELCWIPTALKLPRLATYPMDLVLLCQLVAANFFPDKYQQKYRHDSQWRSVIFDSQDYLLREYYKKCMTAIESREVLLDGLWNSNSERSNET